MKRVLRFALPVTVLVALPMFYNSCQGGLLGTGFNSSSKSCKVAVENGNYTKLEIDENAPPKPFAGGKVRLSADSGSANGVQSKASAALEAGARLGVIIDNACAKADAHSAISKHAVDSGEMQAALNRQAYEWKLDRAYAQSEIEDMAEQDACVIGVSWNKDYKLQSAVFNDTNLPYQTQIPAIRALESYDYFYGASGMQPATGPSVLIAVVDTGVDWNHPDLKSNIWVHSNGVGIDITTLNSGLVDYNPFDASAIGHGTHVSGLIAAVSNNGQGTIGAMPYRAKIMGIKVFKRAANGDLSTTSTYFYNAMRFAYLNGAQVINLSLGSVSSGAASDALAESGVDEALARGVVVVTVIGNADSGNGVVIDGTSMSSIPGMFATKAGVLGVGAFDTATGEKSYFSHYSTKYAEISAPGAESGNTGIYSTLPTALSSYGRLAGTSQAAPLVSAAAGLAIGLIKNSYSAPPTPAEIERLLLASATKSAALAPYFKDGNKLDLLNLVQRIQADYPLTKTGAMIPVASSTCN